MNIVDRARALAFAAHRGQARKYTGEAYITHPEAVVAIVMTVPHTPEMVAAAWLHDVVEDTDTTLHDVEDACGEAVAELVFWLTDTAKPEDGNRATRKGIERQRLATAPAAAQTIKYADLIHNLETIAKHDPKFAVVFQAEKMALLEVMTAGDPVLYRRAKEAAYQGDAA